MAFIKVYHPELDATAQVPPASLAHYEERGWVAADEEALYREITQYVENDQVEEEDVLDSDEDEALNQEDD